MRFLNGRSEEVEMAQTAQTLRVRPGGAVGSGVNWGKPGRGQSASIAFRESRSSRTTNASALRRSSSSLGMSGCQTPSICIRTGRPVIAACIRLSRAGRFQGERQFGQWRFGKRRPSLPIHARGRMFLVGADRP